MTGERKTERRDRLWFRRIFTIGGAAVLVWMFFATLEVVADNNQTAGPLRDVLLALVAGVVLIAGYYVKRRADAERGLE